MNILIFGRSSSSRVRHTRLAVISMLKHLGVTDRYFLKTTLGDGLHDTSWIPNTRLLILPGVYEEGEELHGNILRNIHTFIEAGGSYLAMCNAAYTSCTNASFKSGAINLHGAGKINVFNGFAMGSLYHPVQFNSYNNSRMVPLIHESVNTNEVDTMRHTEKLYGMYSGGPEFIPAWNFYDYQVIARYGDHPEKLAIVQKTQGKGRLILSGVYPMLMSEYVDREEFREDQLMAMERYRHEQRRMWEVFLTYLLKLKKRKGDWQISSSVKD